MEVTKEQFAAFVAAAESKGYVHYKGQEYNGSTNVWWKKLHEEDDSTAPTIVGFMLYDFSDFASTDAHLQKFPYAVDYATILKTTKPNILRQDFTVQPKDLSYTLDVFENFVKELERINEI